MQRFNRRKGFWIALVILAAGAPSALAHDHFTVADSIAMTRVMDPYWLHDGQVKVSPDGRRFFVVTMRGRLAAGDNEFALKVYNIAQAMRLSPAIPESSFIIHTKGNAEAIRNAHWSTDAHSVLFLADNGERAPQIVKFNVDSKTVTALTHADRGVGPFDCKGGTCVFSTATSSNPNEPKRSIRTISGEYLLDLLGITPERAINAYSTLFVRDGKQHRIGESFTETATNAEARVQYWVSNTGRYAIALLPEDAPPRAWRTYVPAPVAREIVEARRIAGSAPREYRYVLLDLAKGTSTKLIDAPMGNETFNGVGADVLWAPDDHSVIVTNQMVPLDSPAADLDKRRSKAAILEINIASLRYKVVTYTDYIYSFPERKTVDDIQYVVSLRWSTDGKQLIVERGSLSGVKRPLFFRRTASGWIESMGRQGASLSDGPIKTWFEQGDSQPARLMARFSNGKQSLLLAPNPQLRKVRFGKVESIDWTDRAGLRWRAGIVYPPNYTKGRRYPVVFQLKGFLPGKFLPDGVFTTAFAAQELAAQGILVVQVAPNNSVLGTDREAETQRIGLEDLVSVLDRQGLIDTTKMGLIGFSRTCYYVEDILTQSKLRFAAATVADGFDGSYVQYVVGFNTPLGSEQEAANGAQPYGQGLVRWMQRAPGFNLDKIRTPLRMETIGLPSLLYSWEIYSGLKRLNRPVEMISIPTGSHVLVQPKDRYASQQGNVDWFRFWLKGEEDRDSTKAMQYARWRELRSLGTK